MLDEAIWKSLASNPTLLQTTPAWVHSIFKMSFTEIEKLPQTLEGIETVREPCFSKPRGGLIEITSSYLEFLKSEIRFRGRKSKRVAEIYTRRLNALSKHEGKMVYEMCIFGMYDPGRIRSCIIFFLPVTFDIICVE
jgi:hypothetical protein